jgi:hypothetical protein
MGRLVVEASEPEDGWRGLQGFVDGKEKPSSAGDEGFSYFSR